MVAINTVLQLSLNVHQWRTQKLYVGGQARAPPLPFPPPSLPLPFPPHPILPSPSLP